MAESGVQVCYFTSSCHYIGLLIAMTENISKYMLYFPVRVRNRLKHSRDTYVQTGGTGAIMRDKKTSKRNSSQKHAPCERASVIRVLGVAGESGECEVYGYSEDPE